MTPATTADGGGEQKIKYESKHTATVRGREQTIWTVHSSPVAETTSGPFGGNEFRWTLSVGQDGVVTTMRSIPYSGQRRYSTEVRQNRADKSSEYRLSVEEVIDRHVSACIEAGEPVREGERENFVAALRSRLLAILRRHDVAANNNGEIDLLAGWESDQ